MSNFKYDCVGRPSNEVIAKKKKNKILKIVLIVSLILLVPLGMYLVFNYHKLDFSVIMGNSVSMNSFLNRKSDFVFGRTYGSSIAIQGGTGKDGKIYYSTTRAGSQKMNDYKSTIYSNGYNVASASNAMKNYPNYKSNDMTVRYDDNKLFYINFDTSNNNNNYSLIFKEDDNIPYKTQEIINGQTNSYHFSNIAYSLTFKKFVTLTKNYIYFYDLVEENGGKRIKVTSKCPMDNSLKQKGVSYTIQGIDINNNISGNLLYLVYQTKVGNAYNNHINLYDLRNCSSSIKKPKAKLANKYDLGYNNYKYELENIFFMNGKMYLGYNSNTFNYIRFYTTNIDSTANLSLTVSKQGKNTYLIAKTSNSNNGYLYYSFCESSDYSKCKFTEFNKKGGYFVMKFKDITIKRKIQKNGTYYFHTYDNFGKRKISNPVVVK